MQISRLILKEILDYTYDPTLYSFLKFYHIKSTVTEFIPDLYGKITKIYPHTNQLQTTRTLTPWLKEGLKVRFAEFPDGSSQALEQSEISPDRYYYINNVIDNDNCIKFNIGNSTFPGDIVDLPYANFDLTIIYDRSFIRVDDQSWLDIGMRVVFENNPTDLTGVEASDVSLNTKYFIREILDDNLIRISQYQFLENTVNDHYKNFIHFLNAKTTNFDMYNDHTFIEGVSEDEVIMLEAQTDEKISEFKKEFGMNELWKPFHILDNFQEYPDDTSISVINDIAENEYVSVNLKFYNPDGTFFDEYELNTADQFAELHPMILHKGTLWNFSVQITELQESRLNLMSRTYPEYLNFELYSSPVQLDIDIPKSNLIFEFGAPEYRFGQVVFEQDIKGTYIPLIIDNFETVLDVVAEYKGTIYKQIPERNYKVGPFLADQNDIFQIPDTSTISVNDPVRFTNPPDSADALDQAEIDPYATYYVKEILNCKEFTISEELGGATFYVPKAPFEFFLTLDVNIFQMTEYVSFTPTESISRELRKYIEPGMEIKFRNPADSTNALLQAEVQPDNIYYVKKVKLRTEGLKNFTVSRITENGLISLKKWQGFLYTDIEVMFANAPDSTGALEEAELSPNKVYYIKEIFRNGYITISETLGGPTLELPYSNFFFYMRLNVATTEFTISETIDGDILPVPYSNFQFEVYHTVNEIHVNDTRWFRESMPVKFTPNGNNSIITTAGLNTTDTFYVHKIVNKNRIKLSINPTDTQSIDLTDVYEKFFIKHDTGNGYIFSSYIGEPKQETVIEIPPNDPTLLDDPEYVPETLTVPTNLRYGKDAEIYSRITLHSTDLNIIPNTSPYQHYFNNVLIPYPEQPSLWAQFYTNKSEYIWGTLPPSPIWEADYIINITGTSQEIEIPPNDPADLEDPNYVPQTYTLSTFTVTGEDRQGVIEDETMPDLHFVVGDKIQFNIDLDAITNNPIWIKNLLSEREYYKAKGSYGNGTTTIQWTILENTNHYYQSITNVSNYGIIYVYPTAATENQELTPEYQDQTLKRAFDLKRPVDKSDLNNKFVYVFELPQDTISEIKANPDLTGGGNEVKIYNDNRKGYLTPMAYLEKRWIYPIHQVLRILQLVGDKVMRVSDEGQMMITVRSPNGIYNYIITGIEK